MASPISSADDYRRHATLRNQFMIANLRLALEITIELIIERIKQTTLFQDVTGNLRASIGVDRLIRATHSLRGQKRVQTKLTVGGVIGDLVSYFGETMVGVIGIGMEYAPDVEKRRGFVAEVFASGYPDKVWQEQAEAAVFATNRELEAA